MFLFYITDIFLIKKYVIFLNKKYVIFLIEKYVIFLIEKMKNMVYFHLKQYYTMQSVF